jgi:hypothetical protein
MVLKPTSDTARCTGFDVLLTTDKNIRYQQNLKGRRLAIVVLGNPQRPAVERCIDRIVAALSAAAPGCDFEVAISEDN